MDKELAGRLLDIFSINSMLDNNIRHKNDGKESYCDDEYRRDEHLIQAAAREVLKKEDK